MINTICWHNTKIRVCHDEEFDISRVVPPYYSLVTGDVDDCNKEFAIEKSDEIKIIWQEDKNRLVLAVTEINDDVYNAFLVLLNVLIKRDMQEHGMYILHASGVVKDNRVIMFFGSSGSGKTATALHLGLGRKAAFLSNGSSVVLFDGKKCKVIGTYKTGIKIRKSTLTQYDKNLSDNIFGSSSDGNGYDEKKVLSPEQLNMIDGEKLLNDDNDIELYIIQLDNMDQTLRYSTDYDYKVSMLLYEDLARELDCAEVFVNIDGQLIYVPSFDNEELYKKRVDFINYFMKEHYSGTVMGGIDEISSKILSGKGEN